MKQILLESSRRINPKWNIFEQGSGKLDLDAALSTALAFIPKISAFPPALDLTDCPYMWPFCLQPLFWTSKPLTLNLTILNSISVTAHLVSARWRPADQGSLVNISFSYPLSFWPYSGWVGVEIRALSSAENVESVASGTIMLEFASAGRIVPVLVPLKVKIAPTPPRARRILWDQFHSIRYPPGFLPRDIISVPNERPFDWQGDHPYTNFAPLYNLMRAEGFFLEIQSSPISCVDLSLYGTLFVPDPEDEFSASEIEALSRAVASGLSLIVVADWYNVELFQTLRFFDDNTRQWWTPITGGSNVPALNELLAPFSIQLGSDVWSGDFFLGQHVGRYSSGTSIVKFPAGGFLFRAPLVREAPGDESVADSKVPILGLYQLGSNGPSEPGRIAVFGDSSCAEARPGESSCLWLISDLLNWSASGAKPGWIGSLEELHEGFHVDLPLPLRASGGLLSRFSKAAFSGSDCTSLNSSGLRTPPGSETYFGEDEFEVSTRTLAPTAWPNAPWRLIVVLALFIITSAVAYSGRRWGRGRRITPGLPS